jgi:hypothetical protein
VAVIIFVNNSKLRSSDSVNDVEETKSRVCDEIAKLRSHDSESTGRGYIIVVDSFHSDHSLLN